MLQQSIFANKLPSNVHQSKNIQYKNNKSTAAILVYNNYITERMQNVHKEYATPTASAVAAVASNQTEMLLNFVFGLLYPITNSNQNLFYMSLSQRNF